MRKNGEDRRYGGDWRYEKYGKYGKNKIQT